MPKLPGIIMNVTNQENVDHSIAHITNVHSTTYGVSVVFIDRLAKVIRKLSYSPQSSDSEKTKSLLCFVNNTETPLALTNNIKQ